MAVRYSATRWVSQSIKDIGMSGTGVGRIDFWVDFLT